MREIKHGWYGTKRWSKLRASQLKHFPLCQACHFANRVVAAEAVDHIIPHRQNRALFITTRLQSLCWSCHSTKTVQEKIDKYYDWSDGNMRVWKLNALDQIVLLHTIKKQ